MDFKTKGYSTIEVIGVSNPNQINEQIVMDIATKMKGNYLLDLK